MVTDEGVEEDLHFTNHVPWVGNLESDAVAYMFVIQNESAFKLGKNQRGFTIFLLIL